MTTDKKAGPTLRKWSRNIHRDLSFVIAGVVLIYAISGIAMNHRNTFNPNYSITQKEFKLEKALPTKQDITADHVKALLEPLDETDNYTKHYFPKENTLKVFLKGGSNLVVDLETQQAEYEKVSRRPVLSSFTYLHYNPGKWWTWFADFVAIALILLTLTGLVMVKGPKGLWGRGGIELLIGIAIPLLFLFL